jgi:hypothetical protein
MTKRILTGLAGLMAFWLDYLCPVFHGVPCPWQLWPVIAVLLILLGVVAFIGLFYAFTGRDLFEELL